MCKNNNKYSYEEAYDIFKQKGYKLLDSAYINRETKMTCVDDKGYKYHVSLGKMLQGKPQMISCSNIYTIENIKNYIKINNIELEIVENKYISNTAKMKFRCKCGEYFDMSWSSLYNKGKRSCDTCMKSQISKSKAFDYHYVYNYIESIGCILLSESYINNSCKLRIKCSCGEEFLTTFANIKSGKKTKCDKCSLRDGFVKKRNSDIEKNFSDGRVLPCKYCDLKNRNQCSSCKIYSYFKRNKVTIKELGDWDVESVIKVIYLVLYKKIDTLNDICDNVLKHKSLKEIVDLLDNKVKIGGNTPQNIRLKCYCCGKDMIRPKNEIYKERVYCSMKCRDEVRSKIFTRENSIVYRNNPEKLELKLIELKNIAKASGYDLLDNIYINNREKMTLKDVDGYLYESTSYDIENNVFNKAFSKSNKYSLHNIRRYIKLNNLKCKLIDTVYQNNTKPMLFECDCGNTFETSLSSFKNGKTACDKCSGSYKWDYESISEFVKENSKCTLLSSRKEANKSNSRITLKCECGNTFSTVFHQFQRGIRVCEDCRIRETRKHDIEYVKEEYMKHGLIPVFDIYTGYNDRHTCINDEGYKVSVSLGNLSKNKGVSVFGNGNPHTRENIIRWLDLHEPTYRLIDKNVNSCRDKIMFECDKGHRYRANWTDFQMGKRCPKCRGDRIRKALSNDIYTFKKYVVETTNGEYECISDKYINAATKVKFIHKECGREFESTPGKFTGSKNRNGSRCPICQSELIESVHATVLKQLFERYKEDVVIEDPSCINPLTGMPLPTDIVCYSEKIVVEVQSWFHDREYQKIKDKIKRDYWESRGFTVYSPDVRDYSSLSMAKIFFKDMVSLPDWIDYKYGKKQIDIRKVQELLNEYKSAKEIGVELGVKRHVIQRLIDRGEVSIKEDHWRVLKNVKKIYKLSLNGDVLALYDNATIAANKNGLAQTCISKAVKNVNGSNYYKGFMWVSEDNFNSGNYIVDASKTRVVKKDIVQLTLDGELVKEYKSMTMAANDLNFGREYISKCIKGERYEYKGFKWMYKDDYEKWLINKK